MHQKAEGRLAAARTMHVAKELMQTSLQPLVKSDDGYCILDMAHTNDKAINIWSGAHEAAASVQAHMCDDNSGRSNSCTTAA